MARPPYIFTAGDNPQSFDLGYQAWGVSVRNLTGQWLSMGSNRWSAPTSQSTFFLDGESAAFYQWAAPPGVVQPASVAGQIAIIAYTPLPLQDSTGAIGGLAASVATVTQIERYAKAAIPAVSVANAGRVIELTDYDRSLWIQDALGVQFFSLSAETFNVKAFGAKGDGVTDDSTAFTNCLTAAAAVVGQGTAGARVVVPPGNFLLASAVTWPAQVDIIGSGIQSSTLRFDGAHDGLRAVDAGPTYAVSGVLRGLHIIGQNGALIGVNVNYRQKVTIEDCQIGAGFASGGIFLNNTIMASVMRCGLGSNGDATHGQLEVDNSTTFHWYRNYISGSPAGVVAGLRIDRTGPISIIGGAIESSGTPIQLSSRAQGVSAVGPGIIHAIDLENPNNGAVAYIELGAGWSGPAAGGVSRISIVGVVTAISGSLTVTRFIRAVSSDMIYVGQCSIALVAGNAGLDLVGAAANNARWSTGINGGSPPYTYIQQNGATITNARPDQPWELIGRQLTSSVVGLTVNSTTPSVAGYSYARTANTLATAITNATGGVDGQLLVIEATDANTTINHGAGGLGSFLLRGGVNLLLVTNRSYFFAYSGNTGTWNQDM